MAGLLDLVRFNPTAGGTADWTFSTIIAGHATPAQAGAVNGRLYKVHSFSSDQSQWELSEGAYNSATGVFARTTILYNSAGTGTATGQSGAGTKINFTTVPQCSVVLMKEDLLLIDEANSWSTTQKKQAQSNILVAPTFTSLLSGSGTYTTPTGCTRLRVRMVGGGGGGGPSGTAGGALGGAGGNTTFGTALLVANGGAGGVLVAGSANAVGGAASLGAGPIGIALQGAPGGGNTNNTGFAGYPLGGHGGASPFGGAGGSGPANTAGAAAIANTGSGGGGSSGSATGGMNSGQGGAAGGFLDAIINSPAATYVYAVGAAGTAGVAGTSGFNGGLGGSGAIYVEEYYGS